MLKTRRDIWRTFINHSLIFKSVTVTAVPSDQSVALLFSHYSGMLQRCKNEVWNEHFHELTVGKHVIENWNLNNNVSVLSAKSLITSSNICLLLEWKVHSQWKCTEASSMHFKREYRQTSDVFWKHTWTQTPQTHNNKSLAKANTVKNCFLFTLYVCINMTQIIIYWTILTCSTQNTTMDIMKV